MSETAKKYLRRSIRERVAAMTNALREIAADCDALAALDGIEKGEKRAWKSVAAKARRALRS